MNLNDNIYGELMARLTYEPTVPAVAVAHRVQESEYRLKIPGRKIRKGNQAISNILGIS